MGLWIARTIQPALAFAISLVRNRHDAEDLVQECYRKLLARSAHYDLSRDGEKLLFKSIANACINFVQRRPPTQSLETVTNEARPSRSASSPPPDARLVQQETEMAIDQALATLPVNQRAVLELSSLGYSLVDVAQITNVSHANARVLLHRARQSVAEKLKMFREGESK